MALLKEEIHYIISQIDTLDMISQCEEDGLNAERHGEAVWLFTWNPNDKKIGDDKDYCLKWYAMVMKVLKHLPRCMEYFCVQPEVSMMGRLHVHGWFTIRDPVKWNKSVKGLFVHNGRFKMNKSRKFDKATKYYVKDIGTKNDVTNYLQDNILPFCHYNWDVILRDIGIRLYTKNVRDIKDIKESRSMDVTAFFKTQDS